VAIVGEAPRHEARVGAVRQRQFVIYLCFFLSGAAGLVYEVVWARQLSLFLGITAYAHTAVIAAYMLGLAAGSWWIGKRSDSLVHPLRFYALLEIGVGLYAATTPWLFGALQTGYAAWAGVSGAGGGHLARFTIALLALLIPTFLMGGTLPLLIRGVTSNLPQLGRLTGRLYGINTLGAAVGIAVAGFLLLPRIGLFNTIMTGVGTNLAIAMVVLLFVSRSSSNAELPATDNIPNESPLALTARQQFYLLSGFAAAGFAALLTQMAWIRSMILIVGGSVYAFAITLTAFLTGIGLGSLVYGRWLSRRLDTAARFEVAAALAFLIGLTTLLGLAVIARLPEWFLLAYGAGWVVNFDLFQLLMFAMCFALMFVPTLLMGALFPLLAVTWTSSLENAGRGIGGAYAVNTAGTIFGSLLGGLVLLPWLGIHYSIMLAGSIYVFAAIGFLRGGNRRKPLDVLAPVSVFILAAWLVPSWDRAVMAGGVYYSPSRYLQSMQGKSLREVVYEEKLLYYKEGLNGTVTVTENEYQKYLVINGKVDGSSKGDLTTQVSLGQLGALLHRDPRNALVIGFGTGITASALATHRSIEDITVLEISPEVIGASRHFVEENRNVLDDPRVSVVAADARNYVLASNRQWDLIVSEPSNPWLSGVSNLFTRDFFQMARQKLAPGGIMAQWFHMYGLSPEDLRSVIRSYSDCFAFVSIWHMQTGDLVMIGSEQPHAMDLQKLQMALADPQIGPDLERAGFSTPRDLMLHYLLGDSEVREFAAGARLNTDDRPQVEFHAPRSMYDHFSADNLAFIVAPVEGKKLSIPLTGQFVPDASGLDARAMNLEIKAVSGAGFDHPEADWLVWRKFFKQEQRQVVGVAEQRELSWNEPGATFHLGVRQQDTPPDTAARNFFMSEVMAAPVLLSSSFTGASGIEADWMFGIDSEQDLLEVVMLWTCPVPGGGVNRFILQMYREDPRQGNQIDFIPNLLNRFECG
jgi:spermidine synthase